MREQELEQVIANYDAELRYLAYKYIGNWTEIEDILQEVYLKVYLKMDTFQGKANIKTWVYKITRNQCIDYLRSRAYRSTVLMENPEELVAFHEAVHDKEPVERELLEKQDKELLCNYICLLPADYQKTLSLYYFNDYSYKEISELFSKDISYVKNRLFRGKRMLRQVYDSRELIG